MINRVKRGLKAPLKLYNLITQQEKLTYYPEDAHKSAARIFMDQLLWIARYRKMNYFYYVYGLDRKNGPRLNQFISQPQFFGLRNKYNHAALIGKRQINYIAVVQDKFIFHQYLSSLGFPTPQVIGVCDKAGIHWLDTENTEPWDMILRKEGLDVFIKELLGECGDGVYPVSIQDGKLICKGEFILPGEFCTMLKGKCVIQKRIIQHTLMQQLNPSSVNSIRIVTARQLHNQEIVVLSALLRTSSGRHQCDNWAAGGITIGVDLETGKLGEYGIFKPGFGKKTASHPNTNIRFKDYEIPYFKQAIELVQKLHPFFYGIHSIGWDIAITPDGPVIIEANDNWDTQMMQVHDPKFKEKYMATLKQTQQ